MNTPKTDEQIAFVKKQLEGDSFGPECADRPYYVLSVMGSFARLQELEEAKLNERIAELEAEVARLKQDKADALNVRSKDGLLSSEWIARTGAAERRAEVAEAEIARLKAGEYICARCGLRKNGEFDRGDF